MGSLLRMGIGLVLCCLVACGGSEFSNEGESGGNDAGADASGGSTSGGGTGGSGGQAGNTGGADAGGNADADAAPINCRSDLFKKTCDDPAITTGDSTCDSCGHTNCCPQTDACLADEVCAQELLCYLEHCLGQSAIACVPPNCPACLGSSGIFLGMSSCLQKFCTPVCPMLIP